MNQADLLHLYKTMKLLKFLMEEYPELFGDEDEVQFLIAWEIINTLLDGRYKDE